MKYINMFLTRKVVVLIALLLFVGILLPPISVAYTDASKIGNTKIVPNFQIFINGNKVENTQKNISIDIDNPTFLGYAYSNVLLYFSLDDGKIKRATTADNNGYWVLTFKEPLPLGTHKLSVSLSDERGISNSAAVVATFTITSQAVNKIGVITIPQATLHKFNYFSISVLVISGVGFLALIYLIAKRREHVDW